jgi:hypothetical protein
MRINPLYAPDGMMSAGSDLAGFSARAVAAHDRYDDGLVHNHNWASSEEGRGTGVFDSLHLDDTFGGLSATSRSYDHSDDRFDDGLVHNHAWAVTEN